MSDDGFDESTAPVDGRVSASGRTGSSPGVPATTFTDRMDVLTERAGGPGRLAEKSNLSRRVIDKYRAGESEPNRERLVALARAGNVTAGWLATGDGPMVPPRRGGALVPTELSELSEGYVALPRYGTPQTAAGAGLQVTREEVVDWVYFKAEWLHRTLGVSPHELAIIEAVGDSMAPTIQDGDLLIVDLTSPKFRSDGIYVIAPGGELDALSVKRVSVGPLGSMIVSSDNQAYGRRDEIPREELEAVRIVGRVVWAGGRI